MNTSRKDPRPTPSPLYGLKIQRAARQSMVITELGPDPRANPLPINFPFLVSEVSGLPFRPFIEFLASRAFVRSTTFVRPTVSRNTVEAWAYDLSDYFAFLDAARVEWDKADVGLISQYADSMIEAPSYVTGKAFADATIRRRLNTIKTFYEWAVSKGIAKKSATFLDSAEHLKSRRLARLSELAPPQPHPERAIEPIDGGALQEILGEMGDPLCPEEPESLSRWLNQSPIRVRDRLIGECGIQTGIRRDEVANLSVAAVRTHTGKTIESLAHYQVRIVGKGERARNVPFPGWLLAAILGYIARPRNEAIGARLDHGKVFVDHSSRGLDVGSYLSPKHVAERFTEACKRAGYLNTESSPEREKRELAKYTFHDLRHNYALATYFSRKLQGDHEPWIYIQAVLGHAHLETTTRIYLRLVKALEAEFSDRYDQIIGRMMGRG